MKIMKKLGAGLLAAALIISMAIPVKVKAAGSGMELSVPDNKVLTYEAGGKALEFKVVVSNTGTTGLKNITVGPDMGSTPAEWPFKTEFQSYTQKIDTLAAGEVKTVSFSLTARDEVKSKTFLVKFKAEGEDDSSAPVDAQNTFRVNTNAKPADTDNNKGNQDNQGGAPSGTDGSDGGVMPASADAGGFSNGDAGYSGGGGGSSAGGSVPRVIVTGFTTDPAEVKAGSNFTLTIHLKNTSKSTKVSNMLFDLAAPTEGNDEQTSAPAFLPASGSNSIYLDGIGANGTADIAIQLNAKSDLVQKPYGINLSMKYEDSNAAQIEGTSSISIPVKQEPRFELSEMELTPEAVAVGDEANASCSLYNLGRIKLYNVKAIFEGKGIKKEEIFIGNVEPGATAAIDAILEATEENGDSGKIKMTLSYEDEAGTATTSDKELALMVAAAAADEGMMSEGMAEEAKGFPVVPVVIAVVVVIAVIGVVIFLKKKKSKLMSDEEEGLLDELDGPAEDE